MSECEYEEIKDYKSAFDCFVQRFLVEKKSIFRLKEADEVILTKESVQYLMDNFVNNGYIGNTNSIEKFCHQLTGKDLNEINEHTFNKDEIVEKNAVEILATAVWLWRLPAKNTNKVARKKLIEEILNFDKSISIAQNNQFIDGFGSGFATVAQGYNSSKADHLAYIIKLFQKYSEEEYSSEDIIEYIKENTTVTIHAIYKYDVDNPDEKSLDKKKYNKPEKLNKTEDSKDVDVKDLCNALLHLVEPKYYQPIVANKHKKLIIDSFTNFKDFEVKDSDDDANLNYILKQLQAKNLAYHFYHESIRNIWLGGFDFESKNMILHGAPGTGKTYMTEETIKARKIIEGNSEYELVQFHPSYGYEDFIEGIKPIGLEQGQMRFELKNGIFKQMCIDAFKNLIESQNDKTKLKTFYFIADEINRAELSRVFGELLLCLEDDKRLRIVDGKVEGTKIKTQNSNLWKNEHIVVKVNEDNELDENGKGYFGVPENIYFIGTMNDIDRSVDSFDMALRRRFVWKHYRCDYEAIENKYKDEKDIEAYITACKNLNNHITTCKNLNNHITTENNNGFNLSDSYELGQAYFMKPKNLTKKELDRVWLEHISPILKEYLRAEYPEKDIIGKLEEAQKIFKI